jgi:hypothetical protein
MGMSARIYDIGAPSLYLGKAHKDYGSRKEPWEEAHSNKETIL